jgi:hypothetical protein
VSHLRPQDRSPKKSRAACKRGRHYYGESQNIGAGITRQVCETCGEVTIDLTGAHEVSAPVIIPSRLLGSVSSSES